MTTKYANLKLNAERVFGKFLPTVYLRQAAVMLNEAAPAKEDQYDWRIRADISLSFTKPDNMNMAEATSFIKKHMNDLYLYTWISPYQNLNRELEAGQLYLKDLFDAQDALKNTNIDNFTIQSPYFPFIMNAAIRSWIAKDKFYGFEPMITDGGTGMTAVEFFQNLSGDPGVHEADPHRTTALFRDDFTNADFMAGWFYSLYPESIKSGVTYPGFTENPSLANLFMFGPNLAGPWNNEEDIHISDIRAAAAATINAAKGENRNYYNELASELEDSAIPEEMLEELGESEGRTFENAGSVLEYVMEVAGAELGVGLDATKETTTSYFAKHAQEFFAETNIAELSEVLYQHKKISLGDLIKPISQGGYGGVLNHESMFDQNDNEIITFSNIRVEFVYDTSLLEDHREAARDLMASLSQVFFIGTVGLDIDNLQGYNIFGYGEGGAGVNMGIGNTGFELFVHKDMDAKRTAKRSMLNHYFGNITYEHVLNENVVPNPYFEHYVYAADKSPYDDVPLQSLNGSLHANEPYRRDQMVSQFEKLIARFKSRSKTDRRMKKHLNNLRLLIERHSHTSQFVQNLKRYQRTFTDKQPTSVYGQFYSEFMDLLSTMNKQIMIQDKIEKRLSVNSTCIDLRPVRPISSTYTRPEPNKPYGWRDMQTADIALGTPRVDSYYDLYVTSEAGSYLNSDYIPEKWSKLTRAIKYIDAEADGASEEFVDIAEHMRKEAIDELSGMPGVDDDYIEAYVTMKLAEIENDYANEGASPSTDQICKNWGYFFFDWEKAIHTRCDMANIVELAKLSVFMNFNIPYSAFRVNQVRAIRYDFPIELLAEIEDAGETLSLSKTDFYRTMMSTTFKKNTVVPEVLMTQHKVYPPTLGNFDHADSVNDETKDKYGKPFVNLCAATDPSFGTEGRPNYSTVQYVNFDVAPCYGSPDRQWLTAGTPGHVTSQDVASVQGTLYAASIGGLDFNIHSDGFNVPFVNTTGIGQPFAMGLINMYRMMAFEINDYMDDDIAIMANASTMANTRASEYRDETSFDTYVHRSIQTANPQSNRNSWYEIKISVEDRTMQYFCKLYEDFFQPLIEAFEEYVEYAEELCSYNKSTEQFNQFFVDAMIEKYITNKEGADVQLSMLTGVVEALANDAMLAQLTGMDDEATSAFDPSLMNFREVVNLIPPWVSGAILSAFVKEIFFNPTPRKDLRKVLNSLVTPLSSFNPETDGAPDQETIKLTREMYQLSPMKGNLLSIQTFMNRIEPLISVLKLEDPDLRDLISERLDIDADDPEFYKKVKNHSSEKRFYGMINIDSPIAPGSGRTDYTSALSQTQKDTMVESLDSGFDPWVDYLNALPAPGEDPGLFGITAPRLIRGGYKGEEYEVRVGWGRTETRTRLQGAKMCTLKAATGPRSKIVNVGPWVKNSLIRHGITWYPYVGANMNIENKAADLMKTEGAALSVWDFLKCIMPEECEAWQNRSLEGKPHADKIFFPWRYVGQTQAAAFISKMADTIYELIFDHSSAAEREEMGIFIDTPEEFRSLLESGPTFPADLIMDDAVLENFPVPYIKTTGEFVTDPDNWGKGIRPKWVHFYFYDYDFSGTDGSGAELEDIMDQSTLAGMVSDYYGS